MDTVVKTRQGAVRGSIVEGIAAFKGIFSSTEYRGCHARRLGCLCQAW